MSTRTTRRAFTAALLAVFALLVGGLATPATSAASTGKVKGAITFDGAPLKAAKVQLFRYDYDTADDPERFEYRRVKTVNTDRTGRYSFSGLKVSKLKTGQSLVMYAILVTDRSGKAVKTLRNVEPKKGKTVTKNVRMAAAAAVTGSVSRSDGGSLAELTVDLASETNYGQSETPEFRPVTHVAVRPDGTFRLEGVEAGYYSVVVRGDAYVPHCYNFAAGVLEKCTGNDAQSFVLKAGETRTLSPATVTQLAPPVSKFSGIVTDASGKPLKGIEVSVGEERTLTRVTGRFTLETHLEAGAYQARFADPKRIWTSQDRSVTIAPGKAVRDFDAILKSATKVKIATKAGRGTAKVAFRITRRATGSGASGTIALSYEGSSAKVAVKKGKATVILTDLPKGTRAIRAVYSGTSNTSGFVKTVKVDVK